MRRYGAWFLKVSTALLLSVPLWGCGVKAIPMTPASVEVPAPADQGRILIRSGSLDLRAKDLEATKTRIERITADLGGRVQDWSLRDGKWLDMTLRVPAKSLDEAMDRLATLGRVTGRSLRARDVTEALIDLEARLRNLKALRDRLRSYLDKASNLEEILKVERELARVQSEIESLEARLKILRDQVAMSELDVRVKKGRGSS